MRLMNHVLGLFIGKFVIVYFDDILIYSLTMDDRLYHVRSVLEVLRHEKLFPNRDKCTFWTNQVVFLGFIVSATRVQVDDEKIKTIKDWPIPKNVSDVRSFHGLDSFYRRFVKDFSIIASLLNDIVKENVEFRWKSEQEKAFNILKEKLTNAPILALPKFSKSFEIECDASNVGIGVLLL